MTFCSAYITLFIYLHLIVLQAPGNIASFVSVVRHVVCKRKRGVEHGKGAEHARGQMAVAFAFVVGRWLVHGTDHMSIGRNMRESIIQGSIVLRQEGRQGENGGQE